MRSISARAFRVSFGDLTEPVTVLRRSPDGSLREIGTWTPSGRYQGNETHGAVVPMGSATARFVAFTPAPKPTRKSK